LVCYADDFVVMCDTKSAVEEARRRVSAVLTRLGLELYPEKTRIVDLSQGHAGIDFLEERLHALLLKRAGSRGFGRGGRRGGVVRSSKRWVSAACVVPFNIRGWCMPRPEDHLVSRVPEIGTYGLNGGHTLSAPLARCDR
jgi:Reverse transcriptase (RNA-dependent DNA polymerase)